jgi:hypothetical protein
MIFGGFDSQLNLPTNLSNLYRVIARIIYVLFSLSVSLVLLNLLIAIMGNTYNKIEKNAAAEWRAQIADILVEIESHHMWMRNLSILV